MLKILGAFKLSYQLVLKDKVSLFFATMPILIGIILFWLIGKSFFGGLTEFGHQTIEQYVSNDSAGEYLAYFLTAIIAVLLYFIVNWTFVLVISIIASPFNDLLSSRIEKQLRNEELPDFREAVSNLRIFSTIFNEIKKVCFILGLSVLAFIIGLIPLLAPISIVLGSLAIATEFLDYSWSRKNLLFKDCRSSLFKNSFSYTFGGAFFMVLIAFPLTGLLVPSWGTSYFTVLWVKNNEHSHQVT